MAVNFTELLENAELTEDVKSALQEAWEGKISEAREEITAELREEFAQRYDHDKSAIVSAVDNFITEKELSKRVGISKVTLGKYRREGKIPFSKIGRTIRYDYNQVIETLKYKQ